MSNEFDDWQEAKVLKGGHAVISYEPPPEPFNDNGEWGTAIPHDVPNLLQHSIAVRKQIYRELLDFACTAVGKRCAKTDFLYREIKRRHDQLKEVGK